MSGRRLPRDLRYAVNRLAHERAQIVGGSFTYGRRYAEEKTRLQALVVTWLTAGDTEEQALAKLHGGRSAAVKMREAIKVLLQRLKELKEMP